MSGFFSSGSEAVDKMGQIQLMGTIVPAIWKKQIVTEKGKPYYLAIELLADFVHWYQPVEIRDEYTGQVIGWKRKFHYDLLQRNYQQLEDQFCEPKKTIQRALQTLEEMGLIKRRWRKLEFSDGTIMRNVMFIEVIPERVHEITYPKKEDIQINENEVSILTERGKVVKIVNEDYTESRTLSNTTPEKKDEPASEQPDLMENTDFSGEMSHERGMDKFVHTPGQICPYPRTDLSIPPDRFVHTPGQECPYPWTDQSIPLDTSVQTNTRITTGKTTGITPSINQSAANRDRMPKSADDRYDRYSNQDNNISAGEYMAIIRENIEYDGLIDSFEAGEKELYEELYNVICDVVCVQRDKIWIGKEEYPYEVVKGRFLKLTSAHLLYVMHCMHNSTKRITNIREYMKKSLYNAPSTMHHYYTAQVQFDMAEGKV